MFLSGDCPTSLNPSHLHTLLPAASPTAPTSSFGVHCLLPTTCPSPKNGPNHLYPPPPPNNRCPLWSTPPSIQLSEPSWSDSNLAVSLLCSKGKLRILLPRCAGTTVTHRGRSEKRESGLCLTPQAGVTSCKGQASALSPLGYSLEPSTSYSWLWFKVRVLRSTSVRVFPEQISILISRLSKEVGRHHLIH